MTLTLLTLLMACGAKTPTTVEAPAAEPEPDVSALLGDWTGPLQVTPSASLRLVLHLVQGEDDALSATLDSPDQGAMGLPATAVSVSPEGELRVALSGLNAELVVSLDEAGALSGTFFQGPAALPITLERGAPAPPARPQEPQEPFPYRSEEVTVTLDDHTLAGTLTLPEGEGPFPGAVLITGSGPQDRDEALAGHRPFAVLADALTRGGIAVLRYDDRGVGASTGDFASATTHDFVDDASAAGSWLVARDDIASLGFVGHSEGGMVAPLAVAATEADWAVLLAAPAVPIPELMVAQGRAVTEAAGLTDAAVLDEQGRLRGEIYAGVIADDRDKAREALRQLTQGALSSDELDQQVDALFTPWWRGFLAYDVTSPLQALSVPVLALYGGKDVQVLATQNAGPMGELLGKNGTVQVFADKNHLFQSAGSGAPGEYAQIEETLAPEVLDTIREWIVSEEKTLGSK